MGAPAGLKLHAELSSLLGTAALALLRATRVCYAALAPALLPRLLGAVDLLPSRERAPQSAPTSRYENDRTFSTNRRQYFARPPFL